MAENAVQHYGNGKDFEASRAGFNNAGTPEAEKAEKDFNKGRSLALFRVLDGLYVAAQRPPDCF